MTRVALIADMHGNAVALVADRPFHPAAEYAVVTASEGTVGVEFHRVPFDVERLAAAALASGMPNAERYVAQWKRA